MEHKGNNVGCEQNVFKLVEYVATFPLSSCCDRKEINERMLATD